MVELAPVGRRKRGAVAIIALVLLVLNVLAVFVPNHRVRIAGVTAPAETVYKPILVLNGGVVLYLLFARRRILGCPARWSAASVLGRLSRLQFGAILAAVATAVYLPALGVNFQHHDWTHRHISAGITSAAAAGRLFFTPQADGMYRPLTFLSLWADYRLFDGRLWGYHLQSIALHVLNAALVSVLAARLGMKTSAGRMAGLLFAVGAIHFEAVLWPAARFDLLAATFTCVTVICFLEFWRAPRVRLGYAELALLTFVLAVLSKETSYSAIPILAALLATPGIWKLESGGRPKALALFGALSASAAILLGARFLLYGGIGGYLDRYGHSIHAAVSVKSFYLLIVNTFALSVFGVNTSAPSSVWTYVVIVCFLGSIATAAAFCSSSGDRRKWGFVLLALLSAAPVVNVIGWIQPSLLHSRHLYWPSVWTTLLLVSCVERRCPVAVMVLYLVAQAAALTYNISAQRNVLYTADSLASHVGRDAGSLETAAPMIRLAGVPESLDGAFYFASELESKIQRSVPGATVRFVADGSDLGPAGAAGGLTYRWDPGGRRLRRMGARSDGNH
jgi:hypothetical protein